MSKSSAEIRQTFLDYFHSKGHQVVSSSSLVPHNDPTLLFTNAGMNQFKDLFLGLDKRDYSRATSAQRCVRAGGKHNDLENVGYTARHHTFFEMLGNFSFGDYFKADAIEFAWELLTAKEWFNLPQERLWVTVYATDDEAYQIWAQEIGVPPARIIRIGDNKGAPYASDNFWQMGETGPCGPCTEIFYDHGAHIWGGPPGSAEEDGDRFIEIWNLVFMQFNRQSDGTLLPLPKPSVDTGMGLERITAVLQGVHSNYEIDLFQVLIAAAAKATGATDLDNKSLRVIADHIRSCAFLIADGVTPSNEGRGYVLRRIIRRAVRHGYMLGAKQTFFYQLVVPLIKVMGAAADELMRQQAKVEQILKTEEEQFARTLERGLMLLDEELAQLTGTVLAGETAFRLYDTYGFPLDLTADVCRERHITVDEAGFERAMEEQRSRAREASGFSTDYNKMVQVDKETQFQGYATLQQDSKVTHIFKEGQPVTQLQVGEEAIIVLAATPFYAESGGQVGDQGEIKTAAGIFAVTDTQKYGRAIGHIGKLLSGRLHAGENVSAIVDALRRQHVMLNHSATHLLHAALREALGPQVTQKGSLVHPEYLRFDFSHAEAISPEQLRLIEDRVNAQIRRNLPIKTEVMELSKAQERGAMALFGEKYTEMVRVLSMSDFSIELCGGTHAAYTGEIGLFRILSESGVAAGVRRIEAVTGEQAINTMHQETDLLHGINKLLKSGPHNVKEKLMALLEQTKQLEKEITHLNNQRTAQESALLTKNIIKVKGINLLVHYLQGGDVKKLRIMVDELKNQLQSGIIVLAITTEDKASLIVGVTHDLTSRIKAGELLAMLTQQAGGKGGGRPDMAQAGGSDINMLTQALSGIETWVADKL